MSGHIAGRRLRGGQGEPNGPSKTAVTVGRAVESVKFGSDSPMAAECVDFWFVGDGQIITRPWGVDAVLRALGAAHAAVGATRGTTADMSLAWVFVVPKFGKDDPR